MSDRRPSLTNATTRGLKLISEREDLAWLMNKSGAGLKGRDRRDVRRAVRYLERLIDWKERRQA